jgi:hypothetical protein
VNGIILKTCGFTDEINFEKFKKIPARRIISSPEEHLIKKWFRY